MAVINIGGSMPDGVKVHEFWIDENLFVCASGAALEIEGESIKLMGKLCLLSDVLIMLPYEGTWLKMGQFLAGELQQLILGEFADMATWMDRFGLIDLEGNYKNIDNILIWPLNIIEGECSVEVHSFLGMHRGASLHLSVNGRDCAFQMSNRGYEVADFASAQDFCDVLNKC